MAINFIVTRQYIVLFLLMFTLFFVNTSSSLETPSLNLHRFKREIYFRPLFIYKEQQRKRQRLWKVRDIYLQHQNSDQQHLENYPSVLINNEYYQSVPVNQLSYTQQYEQQYYQQYYNKYFQQYPQAINNVL